MADTTSNIQKSLEWHVGRLSQERVDAQPVVFGYQGRAEAVLMSYETFQLLLEAAEDTACSQRIRLRESDDSGQRTTLVDAASEHNIDLDEL